MQGCIGIKYKIKWKLHIYDSKEYTNGKTYRSKLSFAIELIYVEDEVV